MKKYLVFSTLAILFFLFGCEEEHALRLHTAPEYYQGRAMLPNGQQIELTEVDRSNVLESCAPDHAVTELPKGDRRWLGTVTLTQPLTATTSTPAFPTATFFNVNDQSFVQCHVESITYVKQIDAVPGSILNFANTADDFPAVAKLRVAQSFERAQFLKELKKPIGNEPYPIRTGMEQTLVHLTMPFEGSLIFTFKAGDAEENVTYPINSTSRDPYLSLGLGTEESDAGTQYAIYTSSNQEKYAEALRPKDAFITRLLGAKLMNDLPSTLEPGKRYPLFSVSYMQDGKAHQQYVSITYKANKLLHGDELKKKMHQQFANRRHAVFHELALIGTKSTDTSFLKHVPAKDRDFLFEAIERSNSTSQFGSPAPMPYLTLFEGVSAQTFDVSYYKDDVFLTNSKTNSHFKLLQEDAERWHELFD